MQCQTRITRVLSSSHQQVYGFIYLFIYFCLTSFFGSMANCTHVFQISGIKIRENKRVLVQGIQQLGGKYIGGSVSRDPASPPTTNTSIESVCNKHPTTIGQSERWA